MAVGFKKTNIHVRITYCLVKEEKNMKLVMWKRSKQIDSTARGQDVQSTVTKRVSISIWLKKKKINKKSIVTCSEKRAGWKLYARTFRIQTGKTTKV